MNSWLKAIRNRVKTRVWWKIVPLNLYSNGLIGGARRRV